MNSTKVGRGICILALLMAVSAQATTLDVAFDVQGQGLALAGAGVGLQGIGTGSRSLTVSIGGPVQGGACRAPWGLRDLAIADPKM